MGWDGVLGGSGKIWSHWDLKFFSFWLVSAGFFSLSTCVKGGDSGC